MGEVIDSRIEDPEFQKGKHVVYWGQSDFMGLAEYRVINPVKGADRTSKSWKTDRDFFDDSRAAAAAIDPERIGETASLLEPLTSVLRSLFWNAPKPGENVIILGAGPCGLLATQVLRRVFACGRITVLDINRDRLAVASDLGADTVVEPRDGADTLEALIRDQDGAHASFVFDTLPHVDARQAGVDTRQQALRLLEPDGRYVIYGATELPQEINTWLLLAKGIRVVAAPFDVRAFPMPKSARVLETAARLAESGLIRLDSLVTAEMAASDEAGIRAAFADYGQGGSLKTVITFDA